MCVRKRIPHHPPRHPHAQASPLTSTGAPTDPSVCSPPPLSLLPSSLPPFLHSSLPPSLPPFLSSPYRPPVLPSRCRPPYHPLFRLSLSFKVSQVNTYTHARARTHTPHTGWYYVHGARTQGMNSQLTEEVICTSAGPCQIHLRLRASAMSSDVSKLAKKKAREVGTCACCLLVCDGGRGGGVGGICSYPLDAVERSRVNTCSYLAGKCHTATHAFCAVTKNATLCAGTPPRRRTLLDAPPCLCLV